MLFQTSASIEPVLPNIRPDQSSAVSEMPREPIEIAALKTNLAFITEAVTVQGTLQWFANRLVTKAFITQEATQGILGSQAVTPARQANQLMDSVFAKIRVSHEKRHLFDEFVHIFSRDTAYGDLVRRLRREGEL